MTIIPWTVGVKQGQAISAVDNKMIVQEEGYFMVYGQVLFHNEGTVMGYSIRRHNPGRRSGELFHCLQEMPEQGGANTCHTAGIAKLNRSDELELAIPDRPRAQIAMDPESTFFGMILLQ
ncbi:tumor necrosis factor ligand superfamily member 13B-like [Denticeps clupeoides]|uniref:tumor necrosis factor ligand superfamily member 13B-like n=1 Tax=Denticeps clupeoides TaxID=299321 RepID=UPI0010A35689|nr:tumor necrosis factor ligand superfamily member 13B-like [Denticeps clupeoides]